MEESRGSFRSITTLAHSKGIPVDNPYSSPQAKSESSSVTRTRQLNVFGTCIGAGTVAAILVYVGDAFRWPHFNRRAGYLGTEYIQDLLYAINDPFAIHIVAFLWFLYTAITAAILLYVVRFLFSKA